MAEVRVPTMTELECQ